MMANRIKTGVLAVAILSALVPAASAGDFRSPERHPRSAYSGVERPGHAHHHGRRGELALFSEKALGGASRAASAPKIARPDAGYDSPFRTSGIVIGSTLYYGDGSRISYLDQRREARQDSGISYPAPRAKIIHVTEEMPDGSIRTNDGCMWEMGVCVIRGGR